MSNFLPRRLPVSCALVLSAFYLVPAIASAQSVGSVAADFRVNERGHATLSVPFNLPTGRGAMKPLIYGYTSTNWNSGTLWKFNARDFKGEHSWNNTCSYLINLSGESKC